MDLAAQLAGLLLVQSGDDKDEFISRISDRIAALRHLLGRDLCEMDQRLVSGGVAVAVVYGLEIIDVDHEEGDVYALLGGLMQEERGLFPEITQVAEAGQLVGVDEGLQLLLVLFSLHRSSSLAHLSRFPCTSSSKI